MVQPTIALLVNDHNRDLPGLVLTAHELCQQGAVVFLMPFASRFDELWALAPDFVLMSVFRPYDVERAHKLIDARIQYGLLDVEGAIWSSPEEYQQTLWKDPALNRAARCVCAWGPSTARFFTENGVFAASQIAVTGCPRFDFYQPPLSRIYDTLDGSTLENRKLVMLNTNFTIGNLALYPPDETVERLVRTYQLDRATVLRWRDADFAAIEQMSQLAGKLADDFPEASFVLRPHPQEKLETYRSKLPSRPNLLLSNRGPVQPWLLRSTAVIHRSCTTAIEVTMAGGVAISPQWITPAAFYPLPEAVSLPVHNYAELAGTLAAHFESSARERLPGVERVRGAIEQELHTQDGRAHKRVANAVLGSLEACGRVDRSRCSRYLHELPARFTLSRKKLPGELRKALGLAPRFSWRKLTTKAPPPFDENYRVESVRSLLNSISVATGLHDVKPVSLQLANDSGRYLHRGFRGRALVLSC